MAKTPAPRVRFIGAQKENSAGDKTVIRVRLEVRSETYVGSAEDDATPAGEQRAAAQATLEALTQAIRTRNVENITFRIREVGPFDAFGKVGVMVSIQAEWGTESRPLLGFSPGGDDPCRSASIAVLSATNRFLAVGPDKS